jgi:hypothetical protein
MSNGFGVRKAHVLFEMARSSSAMTSGGSSAMTSDGGVMK